MALTDTQAKNMKKKKSSFVDDYERKKAVRDLPSPSTGAELSNKAPIKTAVQTKANQPTVKKTSPAQKKKAEQSREKGRTLQVERDELNAKQALSGADKDLSAADRLKVKDAKTAWDQAEAAGDVAGMQAAHKRAEAVRKRYGYSGGVAGDEYISPELTTQELSKLNTLGRQRLKAARMNLETAQKTGDENAIAEAESIISRILELPAYRQAAYQNELTTGQGTPLQVRSRGDMLEAFNRTIAGGEAAAKGFAGSLLSLREISRDFIRENAQERWGGIQKGPAQSDGVTRALMDQETTGQRLMRESREAQQEATRGLSGVEALLANAGISSAQALPGIAASFIPGVGPALGLGLMGAQAAGSKANEMTERGYSAGEALARGLVSGGIEALTERLPIKNLVDIVKTSGGANFLVDVAKQAGLEAGEETASVVLNHVADLVNQDPEAELSLMDLAEAAAVGAISGAGFGAVGSVIGGRVGEAPAVEEATPGNSPWSTVSETFNRAMQAYIQRQAGKNQPTRTGQDILLEAAGIHKSTTQESPTTRQDAPEQMFEQPKQETPAQTKTPVQGQERGETARESLERRQADLMARYDAAFEDPNTTQEQADSMMRELEGLQAERTQLDRREAGQVSRNFGEAESHIDNRTAQDVSARNVKAFQFDHPQLHQYFAEAAQALKTDAEYSFASQRAERGTGTIVQRSEQLARAEGLGLTRQEIVAACDAIINDKGQENYAAAKKVELILDEMLSKGYVPNDGGFDSRVEANQGYIQAKQAIPGAVTGFDQYMRDNSLALELGETTEAELRTEFEATGGVAFGKRLTKLEAEREKISGRIERYVRDYAETRDSYYLEQLMEAQRAADDIAEQIEAIESGEEVARSVGSAAGGFDPYSRMMNEFGTLTPGENPARLVDVPVSTDGRDRVSQFAQNVMEAGNTTDATVGRIQQMIVNKGFSYKPRKDREALVHAVKTIEKKGFTGAYQQWQDVVEGRRTAGKDDMVLAQTLYIEAEQAGDSQTSARLAAEIAAEATRMGQGIQALRLLKKTTKEGKAYYIRKTVENIRKEAANRTKKDVSGIAVDEGLMQKFMEATTKEEEDAALDAVYLDVARKVPPNWTDRLNAWRYFAMLSNPRTHVRNVLGNVIWGGMLKGTNTVSTGLQALMLPVEKRTRGIKADPAAKEFAKQDYEAMKDVLSGGKYESAGSALERQIQRNALGPLSKVTNKVSSALEKEDMWAKKPAYIRSMARFITARGWDPNNLTTEQLEAARNQAIKDAKEATFQDASALASAISQFERTNTATRLLVGGTMPFKGVPINIAKQAYNLSPFGLMTSTVDMLRKVKRGDETAADAIDKFSKGLTGSTVAALGAFLAAQGILNAGASDDEKERALDEASGSQAYSLDLSAIPLDKLGDKVEELTGIETGDWSIPYTFTIDWAAPSIVPLIIGAEVYNVLTAKDEAENGEDTDDSKRLRLVLEALSRSFDLLAEMTTFSGLGSTLRSASYSENGFLPAVVGNVLGNYAGQFIPTPVGALARTIDDTRRSTYTDKDSPIPVGLQKFVQQQANKIPGLSQKSVPYMDVWGREDSGGNMLLRALENFVSPGYGVKVEDAEATQEVERLGDLGYRNALLSVLSKGQKVDLDGDGKEERLTREQWEASNRTRGEAALDLIGEIIGSDNYKALSDKDKAAVIERIYDYATLLGKEAAGADTSNFDGWFFGAKEAEEKVGMSAAKFIELYTQKGMIDSANKDLDKDIAQGLFEEYVDSRTDLTDEQKAYTKENILFFSMVPADSSAYKKAVEAGYTDPEEIQALHEERKNYDLDGDGSYTSKAEILHYISSTTDDPEEQEKKWNALKEKGETRTYAQLEKEYRAQVSAIQTAKTNLDEKVPAEKQSAFAAAISDAGADSQKEIKKALRSVEATEEERIAYYELVKVKQGWKKSWYNIRM